jgi:adenylate cyclase
MRSILTALVTLVIFASAQARDFTDKFAFVMIDDATEQQLGAFPYDRLRCAKAVEACARLRAKAVVLKFFLDKPKSTAGDMALADAMKEIPVLLQARIEENAGAADELPTKFRYHGGGSFQSAVRGERGWIPLPIFLQNAAGVGFVDFDSAAIPFIEEYRRAPYKSLVLISLELAADETAHTRVKNRIALGSRSLSVDSRNLYQANLSTSENFEFLSFADLVNGAIPARAIEGRVVIIGWDSVRTPAATTTQGPIRIHRLFAQCLAAAWRDLKPIPAGVSSAPPQ